MSNLIAFCGLAGCGKTTFALGLVKHRDFHRLSFADPIRGMLLGLGLSLEQMSNGKNEPVSWLGGKTPRQIMQSLGTDWGRQMVDENIWINVARNRIQSALLSKKGVVIDDCRFDNEAALIKDMGGRVIQIMRAGLEPMDHPSEKGISAQFIDQVIVNGYPRVTDCFAKAASLSDGPAA